MHIKRDSQSLILPAALFTLLALTTGCGSASNSKVLAFDEGAGEPGPVAITIFTDTVQLFMEYPRMLPSVEGRFLAHVTVLASGEPVRSGKLRLELTPNGGPTQVFEAAQPTRDGLFIPVAALQAAGSYQARIVVTSDQASETIELPPIVVHADSAAAHAAAHADEQPEARDAVPFLLESQWKIGMLMEQVQSRSLTQRLQVAGEIESPQHAMAEVSAPLAGRLLPPEGGRLPRVGELVKKGQVLGMIDPPLSPTDHAQIEASKIGRKSIQVELLLREYDLQAKELEIEQAAAQAQTNVKFAQQTLTRLEGLRAKDLGTQAELEAARRDLTLAQQELASNEALRASYAGARERLSSLRSSAQAAAGAALGRQLLVAPISGEVEASTHVEGEHLEAGAEIFRLINFDLVWVSAHISEFDFSSIGANPGALVELEAFPERRFDVLQEMGGRLVHVAHVVDPETRTIELSYECPNPEKVFRSGMFADVFLETKTAIDAVALPNSAIVTDNGQAVAFVLLDGETFQKRTLELGIRDGDYVEVLGGIESGERVVTKGAYLVKLASASPAAFGAGHAH